MEPGRVRGTLGERRREGGRVCWAEREYTGKEESRRERVQRERGGGKKGDYVMIIRYCDYSAFRRYL